jgi:predicted DNA-binding transcriptional regulator YafY
VDKTERLYAVAEELRRAGRAGTTGRRLARLFEVSERTIKRDVSALQQAGLPVWAQAGPGGGYVLDASATLPPVNFTPQQAVALAISLAALPPGSPFAVDAAAAQDKIWDALGPQARERASMLAARVWVDRGTGVPEARGGQPEALDAPASVSATAPSSAPLATPATLRAVEQSLARHRVLALRYRDSGGTATSRHVEPVLLAHTGQAWYLIAWCRTREAVRWFRLDRVERADLTVEVYVPRPAEEAGEPPASARPVRHPAS